MAQLNMVPGRVTCPRHGLEINISQTQTAPYDAMFFWWYCPSCQDWHPTQGCLTDSSKSVKNRERNDKEDAKAMSFVRSARSGEC